jgi:hypothetical protein
MGPAISSSGACVRSWLHDLTPKALNRASACLPLSPVKLTTPSRSIAYELSIARWKAYPGRRIQHFGPRQTCGSRLRQVPISPPSHCHPTKPGTRVDGTKIPTPIPDTKYRNAFHGPHDPKPSKNLEPDSISCSAPIGLQLNEPGLPSSTP